MHIVFRFCIVQCYIVMYIPNSPDLFQQIPAIIDNVCSPRSKSILRARISFLLNKCMSYFWHFLPIVPYWKWTMNGASEGGGGRVLLREVQWLMKKFLETRWRLNRGKSKFKRISVAKLQREKLIKKWSKHNLRRCST